MSSPSVTASSIAGKSKRERSTFRSEARSTKKGRKSGSSPSTYEYRNDKNKLNDRDEECCRNYIKRLGPNFPVNRIIRIVEGGSTRSMQQPQCCPPPPPIFCPPPPPPVIVYPPNPPFPGSPPQQQFPAFPQPPPMPMPAMYPPPPPMPMYPPPPAGPIGPWGRGPPFLPPPGNFNGNGMDPSAYNNCNFYVADPQGVRKPGFSNNVDSPSGESYKYPKRDSKHRSRRNGQQACSCGCNAPTHKGYRKRCIPNLDDRPAPRPRSRTPDRWPGSRRNMYRRSPSQGSLDSPMQGQRNRSRGKKNQIIRIETSPRECPPLPQQYPPPMQCPVGDKMNHCCQKCIEKLIEQRVNERIKALAPPPPPPPPPPAPPPPKPKQCGKCRPCCKPCCGNAKPCGCSNSCRRRQCRGGGGCNKCKCCCKNKTASKPLSPVAPPNHTVAQTSTASIPQPKIIPPPSQSAQTSAVSIHRHKPKPIPPPPSTLTSTVSIKADQTQTSTAAIPSQRKIHPPAKSVQTSTVSIQPPPPPSKSALTLNASISIQVGETQTSQKKIPSRAIAQTSTTSIPPPSRSIVKTSNASTSPPPRICQRPECRKGCCCKNAFSPKYTAPPRSYEVPPSPSAAASPHPRVCARPQCQGGCRCKRKSLPNLAPRPLPPPKHHTSITVLYSHKF